MKLVIEIPDKYITNDTNLLDWMKLANDNKEFKCNPLPKGHGRIIDYGYVVDAIDDWINAEEYCYTNATDYLRNRIRNVPTIIEAEGSDAE